MSKKCLCLLCKVHFFDLDPLEGVTASPNLQTDSIHNKFSLDCLKTCKPGSLADHPPLVQPCQYSGLDYIQYCRATHIYGTCLQVVAPLSTTKELSRKLDGVCTDTQLWGFFGLTCIKEKMISAAE